MIRFVAPRPRTFVVLLIALVVASAFYLRAFRRSAVHAAERPSVAANEQTRAAARRASSAGATPVLVELFTSEGCSSCPSADALLARLQRAQPVPDAEVLALEEHVDYWDSLGWHDRFSSQQFSARQSAYVERLSLNSEYTPQMIVDGTDQFVGSDVVHALRSIARAAATPKLTLSLSPLSVDGNRIAGQVLVPRPAASRRRSAPVPHADVYAALVQSMASTQVLTGENGGQTLHHVSVVRGMQRIGSLAQATSMPLKFSFAAPSDAATADLRVVIFIQRAGQGAVLGAASSAPIAPPAPQISATAGQ